jgi:NCS1 family nucleobase:cation symporter-1
MGSVDYPARIGYSALLGPIAGIMIADYWIVRRQQLDVPDLYRVNGRYADTNWRAIAALIVGIAPNVPGFLGAVKVLEGDPTVWDEIYPYAWFTGVLLAAGTVPSRGPCAPMLGQLP